MKVSQTMAALWREAAVVLAPDAPAPAVCPCCGRPRVEPRGPSTDTLVLEGTIAEWPERWGEFSSVSVEQRLRGMTAPRLLVRLDSPGGNLGEALTIFRLLRRHRKAVATGGIAVHVETAESAATLVMCAGDRVLIAPEGGRMVLHPPQWSGTGDATRLRAEGARLERLTKVWARLLRRRCKRDMDEFLAEGIHIFSASSAVGIGLADGIAPPDEKKPAPRPARAMAINLGGNP